MKAELVPVTLAEARAFVNLHHGHNEAPVGWKWGAALALDGETVGVAMAGRPTARGLDQHRAIEITRCCLIEKGAYRNAASMLYGALCRAAAALGYLEAYTYTLEEEDAASVRASGFTLDARLDARPSWSTPSRLRQDATLFGERVRPTGPKVRWRRTL